MFVVIAPAGARDFLGWDPCLDQTVCLLPVGILNLFSSFVAFCTVGPHQRAHGCY